MPGLQHWQSSKEESLSVGDVKIGHEHADNSEAQEREHISDKPDGGFQAWLQVAGALSLFMNSWGLINIFGVFQTYYELNTGWPQSASDISWIGSLQAFLLFFGGAVAGPFFDMGYLRYLLLMGTFLVPFGLMMTSISREYWQVMLAQGLCIGIGMSCIFLPSVTIVSQYFSKKKSLAFGIASLGSVVGGVVYEVIFRQLEPTLGFGWATRIIAFVIFATMMVPLLGMKQKPTPPSSKPWFEFFNPTVFRYTPFTVYCAGLFLGFTAVYVTLFYIQLFAIEKTNTEPTLASYILIVIIATSTVGRVIPNWLADIIGPLNVHIPMTFVCALLCFCWIAVSNQSGVIAFCVFYGMFSGAFTSLPGVTVMSLSPDLSMIGIQVGLSLMVAGFGTLIGEPIAGAILRGSGGWVGLQVFCGVLLAASGVLMAVARFLKTGWKLLAKA